MKIVSIRFSQEDLDKLEFIKSEMTKLGLDLNISQLTKSCINMIFRELAYGEENPWYTTKKQNNVLKNRKKHTIKNE